MALGSVIVAMSTALVTDLYELNMAASYMRRGMTQRATFSLYVRSLPPERGFAVAAGIDDCIDYLERFAFGDEDFEWMRAHGFDEPSAEAICALRFTGDVDAVSEGRLVLADEPILEVSAPLPEAQLVESYLLNQVTFQSAIATKAVRCRLAAGDIALVDFALRRTHGVEASMAVARLSAMAGFVGTSNVEAARRLGTAAAGTMAHSYVEAFPSEAEAFRAFVSDLPPPYTFLVDTYDTLQGTRAAADVIGELGLTGQLAVRLDSGDLVGLSRAARALLDDRGLEGVRIFVSGGLDEYSLEALRRAGAPVDAAGIGTRFGVSADAPYFDTVYKLVALDGRPMMKLAAGKETMPGAKQVWRRPGGSDLLALREEPAPPRSEPLLGRAMRDGRRVVERTSIDSGRARIERDLAWLPGDARRIRSPLAPEPRRSPALQALFDAGAATLRARARRDG